jgi:hypothetical protein
MISFACVANHPPAGPISRNRSASFASSAQHQPLHCGVFKLWGVVDAEQCGRQRPPARSVFITEWTSSLLPHRSRSHQIAGGLVVGHNTEQFVGPLLAEVLRWERQLRFGNGSCASSPSGSWRSGSRIAKNR